uniref:HNH endonuclease n=1 Tax=Globodera pallida TaxID=36090 RepID=A0A183CL26_GLOPA
LTPRYAGIVGANRHYQLCRNRLPWIYPMICAHEWYWVPQAIGPSG